MSFQQFATLIWSRRRLGIICLSITVIATLIVSLMLPKRYLATTALAIDQRGIDPITGAVLPTQLMFGYMETQVDIISSHNVAYKAAIALKLDEDKELQAEFLRSKTSGDMRDWIADRLLKKLNVAPSRESSIIKISFTSEDPQFSALAANAFAQAYIQTTVDLKVQPAKLNADWFDTQLNNLRKNLEKAQEKLSVFQQAHGIVMAVEHLDLEDEHLAELSRQLNESQGHTYELMSRKNQLADALAGREPIESLPEVLNSNVLQRLKSDLASAEGKFAEVSQSLDKNHPLYKQAQAEVSSLKKRIQAEISTVLNGIASSAAASKQHDDSLASALNEQKDRVLKLQQHHDEIAVLKREVENAQRSYDAAMQRSFQTRLESELSQANIAVLNPAIPPTNPAKPNVKKNLLLSTFLGTLFGVGAIFVAELQDRRVHSSIDISDNLDLPVLGVISAHRQNNKKLRWPFTFVKRSLS